MAWDVFSGSLMEKDVTRIRETSSRKTNQERRRLSYSSSPNLLSPSSSSLRHYLLLLKGPFSSADKTTLYSSRGSQGERGGEGRGLFLSETNHQNLSAFGTERERNAEASRKYPIYSFSIRSSNEHKRE